MPDIGGGATGDLYLEVDVSPHPRYRASGRDVFFDLPLAPWEAVLAAEVRVATPTGPVALKVPPGSGQGRQLRLTGRGLPRVAGRRPVRGAEHRAAPGHVRCR